MTIDLQSLRKNNDPVSQSSADILSGIQELRSEVAALRRLMKERGGTSEVVSNYKVEKGYPRIGTRRPSQLPTAKRTVDEETLKNSDTNCGGCSRGIYGCAFGCEPTTKDWIRHRLELGL